MTRNTVYVPSVVSDVDLGNSHSTENRNVYLTDFKGKNVYPGISLGQAFIYLDEKGFNYVFLKAVSGIRYLCKNDKCLGPIPGTPRSIIYLSPLISIVTSTPLSEESLFVVNEHTMEKVYEFTSIVEGGTSQSHCALEKIVQGFAGKTLYIIASAGGKPSCRDVLLIGEKSGKFTRKEFEHLIPLNWSGQWFSFISIKKDVVEHHIFLYNKEHVKYKLRGELYKEDLLNSEIVTYHKRSDLIVLCSERRLKAVNLKRGEVIWQKTFDDNIHCVTHPLNSENIAVYSKHEVFTLNAKTGDVLFNEKYDDKITAVSHSEDHLIVGAGEILYIYQASKGYESRGKFVVPGIISAINTWKNELLISYITLGGTLRAFYADLSRYIELETVNLTSTTLLSNTSIEIPIPIPNAEVRLFKSPTPTLRVIKQQDKYMLVDSGSAAGVYPITLQLSIPEHLSPLIDMNVKVESPEKVLKSITVSSKLSYGPLGIYIPVTISTDTPIDEIYISLSSSDNTIYGLTPLYSNLAPGEHTLPLYIMWAKPGKHYAEMHIIGRYGANKLHHRIRIELVIEKGITPKTL